MDFNKAAESLGESGGRALCAMVYKIHNYKDVGLNTLENYFILMQCLFYSIVPESRDSKHIYIYIYTTPQILSKTVLSDISWVSIHVELKLDALTQRRLICMLRGWNRLSIIQMDDDRPSYQKSLNSSGVIVTTAYGAHK